MLKYRAFLHFGQRNLCNCKVNKVANINLNETQERLVLKLAKSIFRPCCNNSTFFQDCNHGSAMLGLLELGASQGRSEEELYAIALNANSYWYAEKYSRIGLYFEEIEGEELKRYPCSRAPFT